MAANYTGEERQRFAIAHLNSALESLHNAHDLIPGGLLPGLNNISIPGLIKQVTQLKEATTSPGGTRYFDLMAELKELLRAKFEEERV